MNKKLLLIGAISSLVTAVFFVGASFALNAYMNAIYTAQNEGAKMAVQAIINMASQNGSVTFDGIDEKTGEKTTIKLNLDKNTKNLTEQKNGKLNESSKTSN